ncbi:MAG: hypothetical protein ACR2OR_16180 [Hyphomicrobiales bacterium]
MSSRLLVAIPTVSFIFAALIFSASAPQAVNAASIYDAQVLRYLKLQSTQRSKVRKIIRQSDAEMARVFRKHKINPNAKPDFDKLVAASSELTAIERRERKAMKQVLNADQLKQYDELINITRIRVRKAAN